MVLVLDCPAVVAIAVDKLTSLLVADAYEIKVGVVGDNINTSEGAKFISIVISPYNELKRSIYIPC